MKTSAGIRRSNRERRETSTDSVLTAARNLFVVRGYAQTSIDEIARSVGLSKGAVYFYFDNKTALLLELLNQSEVQLFDPVFAKIRAARGTPTDKLVMFINWIAGYGAEHKELLLLPVLMSLEFYGRDDAVEHRVKEMYRRIEKELTRIMREGQKKSEFTADLPAKAQAEVVIGLVDGLLLQWYRRSDELDGPMLARAARNIVLDGVRPEKNIINDSIMKVRHNVVFLCFCAVFVCYIDRVNISVAIIAMQEVFQWSDTTKGLVLSSFFVGYMITQAPSGWLTNRYGGKLVLGLAVVSWSIFTILTPPAAGISLTVLIAVRIAMGMGEAAMFPATYGMFAYWVPEAERTRSTSFMIGGVPMGTLFALMTTGWIVEKFGWPWVFYIFGSVGLVWAVVWYFKVSSYPEHHPGLSEEEKQLLGEISHDSHSKDGVPLRKLISHRAILAIFINHFASNWGLYLMLAWLPSYFRDVQQLSISSAGLYSAAPWLTMFIMVNAAGWIADKLVAGRWSLTSVRKLMQCAGLFGSAAFFLAAQYAASPLVAVAIMSGALGCIALTWAGWAPNLFDTAPRYADVLMGISNTFATIPGIVGVALAGWLVDTTGSYTTVFVVAAAVQTIGGIIWLLYATGERIFE